MTKYRQLFLQMCDQNEQMFADFQKVHDGYKEDRKVWSKKFHQLGAPVVEVVREWEQKLCAGMERGKNAVYSAKLAEKFWSEVKSRFSHIELVGVKSNLD